MATISTHVGGLTPDDISVIHNYRGEPQPILLTIADVLIDVRDDTFSNPDTAVLIAALEKLAELALQVAAELRATPESGGE